MPFVSEHHRILTPPYIRMRSHHELNTDRRHLLSQERDLCPSLVLKESTPRTRVVTGKHRFGCKTNVFLPNLLGSMYFVNFYF